MIKKFNKLVRDRIPEIIISNQGKPDYMVLSDAEYIYELEKKLDEELAEYHESKKLEEIADVLEVLFAISKARGVSQDEIMKLRMEKAITRGGFEKRIFLKTVSTFQIEQINYERLEELLELMRERAKWLESINQPMWNLQYLEQEKFIEKYQQPACFLASDGEEKIGGFILLEEDSFLWAEQVNEAAYYLHKLVVRQGYSGKGYAERMIAWVKELAHKEGKKYLRLDCYADREYLRQLYQKCDFVEQEIVVMPDGTGIVKFEYRL